MRDPDPPAEIEFGDAFVDLAHADHPTDPARGPAAMHIGAEGNETPLRIAVCRPPDLSMPLVMPTASIYDVLKARAPTIRHIPATLQGLWSRPHAAILNAFCSGPSDILLWGLLAMPKLVLRVTKTRGKNAATHQQDLIRGRLCQFEQGDWQALWDALQSESGHPQVPETRAAKRARTDSRSANSAAVRRAQQCLAEGSPGKAVQQLTSPGIHDPKEPAIWESLCQLHPRGSPVLLEELPAEVALDLGDEDLAGFWEPLVRDAIASFPRSSGPGPSGLRVTHLQDAVRRPGGGAPLVSALARFCHMWAHGKVPQDMAPALCGANLTPLRKKDGGYGPLQWEKYSEGWLVRHSSALRWQRMKYPHWPPSKSELVCPGGLRV